MKEEITTADKLDFLQMSITQCRKALNSMEFELRELRKAECKNQLELIDKEKCKTVEEFVNDNCLKKANSKEIAKDLYDMYKQYAFSIGIESVLKNRDFYSTLRFLGYEIRSGSRNKHTVFGLQIKR